MTPIIAEDHMIHLTMGMSTSSMQAQAEYQGTGVCETDFLQCNDVLLIADHAILIREVQYRRSGVVTHPLGIEWRGFEVDLSEFEQQFQAPLTDEDFEEALRTIAKIARETDE